MSRRDLLRYAGIASAAGLLAACQPVVVKETVVVKEAVEVEKEVTRVVEVKAAEEQVTIRYHCRAGAVVAPSSEYPTHQNRLLEFMEEHPEIKVVREDIANTTLHDYYVKLATMIAGGTVGHMTWDHQSDCDHHRLAFEGVLLPLDDYKERDAVDENEWWPAAMVNAKWGGKLYGLPMCLHPGCQAFLFYNKTAWDAAGLKSPADEDYTLDDLREAALALSQGPADAREVYGFDPFHRYVGSQIKEGWIRAFGAYSFVNEEGTQTLMNSEAALEWAKFGYDLYNVDRTAPFAEALPSGGLLAMFAAGKVMSFQSGTWSIKTSLAAVGNNFEEAIVLPPKGPAKRGTGAYLDTFAMINRDATQAQRDATWLLTRAFTDKRCGYLQIKLSGSLPGRGDFMDYPDLQADPIVVLSHKAIMESEPQFKLANFRGAEHELTMHNLLTSIWLGEQEPTQAYMDQIATQLQAILDKKA